MTSCQCQGIENQFNSREAAKKLGDYHKNGPAGTTRLLIEALKEAGVEGRTLLDIGGGIGAIQTELLKAGAQSAVSVDASTAYIEAAQQEALRLKRLRDKRIGTGFQTTKNIHRIGVRSKKNDVNILQSGVRPDCPAKIVTIHFRHHDIADDKSWMFLPDHV